MIEQLAINFSAEVKARDRGMRLSASAHHTDLRLARSIARELAQGGAVLCADQVRFAMLDRFPDTDWGNWAGSIFTGDEWAFVGFTRSTAPGRRANLIRTWRLK